MDPGVRLRGVFQLRSAETIFVGAISSWGRIAGEPDQTICGDGMNWAKGNLGWIEVVCGPMFSGKSEELIRRLRRAEIARQRVQIFKPGIDNRYSADHIVSHSDLKIRSTAVRDSADIEAQLDLRTEVIGIDEAQFLGCLLYTSPS